MNTSLLSKSSRSLRKITVITSMIFLAIAIVSSTYGYLNDHTGRATLYGIAAVGSSLLCFLIVVQYIFIRHVRADTTSTILYALFNHNPNAILVIDGAGHIINANPACTEVSGFPFEELIGKDFRELTRQDVNDETTNDTYQQLGTLFLNGATFTAEHALRHRNGYYIEQSISAMPVREGEDIVAAVLVCQDISERKRAMERIRHMAYYDDLTGIPNRRYFREAVEQALLEAKNSNNEVAILILDIDRFKMINGSLGHDIGNIILLQLAERLTRRLSASDTLAHMGGDEFAICYRHTSDRRQIEQLAKQIHLAVDEPFVIQGFTISVTVSIGIALSDGESTDVDHLIKNADIALFKSKQLGKNIFQFYAPEMESGTLDQLALESELHLALDRDEFVLYYQPMYDIVDHQLIGMEALIRWIHPERGLIPPLQFIPIAEENGLIIPIGNKVLEMACRQNKEWQDAGMTPLPVAVNLSARQFLQPGFVDLVVETLRRTELEPQYLELEITESLTLDIENSEPILNQLKEIGVNICVDDFGTGYSSLSYLKKLPISKLKIDRSFVRDVMEDQNDAEIVTTIISMGHNLNMRVIAEGVETEPQLLFLKSNRCDEAQGFMFSRPVPAEEFFAKFRDGQMPEY